ncbi:16S rRNA (cytosine(1402)-N(4))-methyltransferase RsmH [Patescibacteria group bacterium]
MKSKKTHVPVMVREVIKFLNVHLNSRIIDATLGYGGHALRFIEKGAVVLGIEDDPETFAEVTKQFKSVDIGRSKFVNDNFINIDAIAKAEGFEKVDGILLDLGVNTPQLVSETRGFSFSNESAPLDMRLNQITNSVKASDLLNNLREDQLIALFDEFGVPSAKRLTRLIIKRREGVRFQTVGDLLGVVSKLPVRRGKINPATNVFMALRIAVNSENENLKIALPKAFNLLKQSGRMAVISFHSGEDRVVKRFFRSIESENRGTLILKKPIAPSVDEVAANKSARSAKLRVIEKL